MPLEPDVFRTIPEILSLFNLEPTIRNVYVEGTNDRHIIRHYLFYHQLLDISVYDIATVNIPFEDFKDEGLEDNNRSRVIFLARELERRSSQDLFDRVVCLADADFAYLLRIDHHEKLLVLTDFTSMELYAFNAVALRKFLSLVLRKSDLDPSDVLTQMTPVLVELFLYRAVSHLLRLSLSTLPVAKACSIRSGRCVFDPSDYVKRLLNKNSRTRLRDDFLNEVERLRSEAPTDVRMVIHGHDFVELLYWYLTAALRPRRRLDEFLFEGALATSIETLDLDGTHLFEQLRRRLSKASSQPQGSS